MLFAYSPNHASELLEVNELNQDLISDALWLDLLNPTKHDELITEQCLNIDIPTRDEMREIEISSRLYKEDGILFMTATMLAESHSLDIKYDAVTFILTDNQLISIRYIEPQAIKLFSHKLTKQFAHDDAPTLLIDLLETTVDRLADILEAVGRHLEEHSKGIFRPELSKHNHKPLDYQLLLQQIGINGDLNTKTRESLLSFNRLITFFTQNMINKLSAENQVRLVTLSKDILSLSDHANFISSKVNFLLDATLGMVSIEQNKIIKIFSVAAVIFLPPTLIASIYGMNFKHMPELSWQGGYGMAIILMLLSAWLPYKYFKSRNWL
jgi:magnesium transporter